MPRLLPWMLLSSLCAIPPFAAESPAPPLDLPPLPSPEVTPQQSRAEKSPESILVPFNRSVGGGLRVEPGFTPREVVPRLPTPELWGEEIDGLISLFGGEPNFREVLASVRVDLVKLKEKSGPGPLDSQSLATYEEVETKVLNSEDARTAVAVATKDANYAWGELPECWPDYGFRLKFRSQDRVIVLDLCFKCHTARVAYAGKEVATTSFKPGHAEWVKLVERYFKGALDPQ